MHGPVTVSGGNDGAPHDGDIAIATEVKVGVTVLIVVVTKTAITATVDINSTTEE
jgi:hypothetical protein